MEYKTKPCYNILFSCVGRRVELIQAFRSAADELEIKIKIFSTDNQTLVPASLFSDVFCTVCNISDPYYIEELFNICKKNNIDILIPTIDTDLIILSKNKSKFAEIGTQILISDFDKINICRDKNSTANFFLKCGVKTPPTHNDVSLYDNRYPCFIKPKDGSSSINAFKAYNYEELEFYANRIQDYIIQPYIDGDEFTVDILCNLNGDIIYIVPRERISVRSGEVLKTKVTLNRKIILECMDILKEFRPCGPITIQLIREKSTEDHYYIEINPRFGGGAPLSMKSGADSAKVILEILIGKKNIEPDYIENNKVLCRFDQSIKCPPKTPELTISCLNDYKPASNIKALIFDLDDTLFPEEEYVKSGFKEVAKLFPCIPDFFNMLFESYSNSEKAIDNVLHNNNIYSEELKAKCLEIYRNHTPQISLTNEMNSMLNSYKRKNYLLGLITDGRVEGQNAKIKALSLEHIMDEIIITDSLGGPQFRKPCDIAFRIMQKRLNIPFIKMAYIGDNLQKDFFAPLQLGMQTIHLNVGRR